MANIVRNVTAPLVRDRANEAMKAELCAQKAKKAQEELCTATAEIQRLKGCQAERGQRLRRAQEEHDKLAERKNSLRGGSGKGTGRVAGRN